MESALARDFWPYSWSVAHLGGAEKTIDLRSGIKEELLTTPTGPRTCAGEPKRFLIFRLNHSAKVSFDQ